MQMKTSCRALAAFVTLACSVCCISPCFSAAAYTEPNLISATDSQDPIESLNQEHTAQYPDAERLYDKENSLDTIVYSNGDGTETAYFFDEPIKYYNEAGELCDKTNRLYSVSDYRDDMPEYAYATLDNDIKTYYPFELTVESGIIIETPIATIEMSPVGDFASLASEKDGIIEYNEAFGDSTALKYTPIFSGYKEDLIIYEYSTNVFSFVMETNNLVPVLDESSSIILLDEKSEAYAMLNPLYVYDSCDEGCNIAINNYYEIKEVDASTYVVNVVVDDEFLTSPETVYPVIVDPTITINATGSGSSKSILDTPIYNGSGVATQTAGVNSTAVLGYVSGTYGSGRLLMRFPGLASQTFWNEYYAVNSATLTLKEGSGLSATSTIGVYNYTGESWDEGSVYSASRWNGVGSLLSTQTYSYPNYTLRSFNITSAVRNWKTDSAAFGRGIILKNNTNENSITYRKVLHTTESTVKPYLTVNYQTVRPIANGVYFIKNAKSNKYLQVKNGSSSNLSETVQYGYHGDTYQRFKVTCESDGYYTLRPMNVSGQTSVIEIPSPTVDGTDGRINSYSSSSNLQKFMIRSVADEQFQIGTKASNGEKVLEVTNSTSNDNEIVQIWQYSDTRINDNWIFEKVNFGSAPSYSDIEIPNYSNLQNCAGFALMIQQYITYNLLGVSEWDDVETVAAATIVYFNNYYSGQSPTRTIRRIPGRNNIPTFEIEDNEYRVAVRVVDTGDDYDYHYMLQLDDGSWAHKPGNAPSEQFGFNNPSTSVWEHYYGDLYINYNSDVIYFAVSD